MNAAESGFVILSISHRIASKLAFCTSGQLEPCASFFFLSFYFYLNPSKGVLGFMCLLYFKGLKCLYNWSWGIDLMGNKKAPGDKWLVKGS